MERVRIPDILWMHSKPRNIILVTADWAGVTMTRQWSAGVVQSCCNHYQWSNVMWWENSFSILSISVIQITPIVARCSHEHYPMKLLVLVVDMNGRRRGHDQDHVCAVLWIVLILSIDTRHASVIWQCLMILYKSTLLHFDNMVRHVYKLEVRLLLDCSMGFCSPPVGE